MLAFKLQLFKKVTIPQGGVLPRLVLSMKKGNMIPMAGATVAAAAGSPPPKASTSKAPASKKKATKAAAKMIKAALDAAKTTPTKRGRGKSV